MKNRNKQKDEDKKKDKKEEKKEQNGENEEEEFKEEEKKTKKNQYLIHQDIKYQIMLGKVIIVVFLHMVKQVMVNHI